MRNKIFLVGVTVLAATLSGCGNESDVLPGDGREVTDPQNVNADLYSGRAVADGYLRDAFVWLDMNDDNAWDESEPSAYTTEGGVFTLDLIALNDAKRAANQKIIDPRNYPMVLLAIPNKTVDEGVTNGSGIVDKAFFLLSPPDNNLISPLSTLVRAQRKTSFIYSSFAGTNKAVETIREDVATDHNNVRESMQRSNNFLQDYVNANVSRSSAYGSGVVQLIQSHTSDEVSNALLAGNLSAYDANSIAIITKSAYTLIPSVWDQIDTLAGPEGDYQAVDVGQVVVEVIPIDLRDPYVLATESTFKNKDTSAEKPLRVSPTHLSSLVTYEISTEGIVQSYTVDGYRDFSPMSLFNIETEQQWQKNDVVDQKVVLIREGNFVSGVEVDSIHALDKDSTLTKVQASDITLNSNPYEFDGVADIRWTVVRDENHRVVTGSLSNLVGQFEYSYTYDDETGRLATISETGMVDGIPRLIREMQFTYDLSKVVKDVNNNNVTVEIAMKIIESDVSGEQPQLRKAYEFVNKVILVNGVSRTVPDYVFIEDRTRFNSDRYLRWDHDYYSTVDIARMEGINTIGLDESDPADLEAARAMVKDKKLLELEGMPIDLYLRGTRETGLSQQSQREYIRNVYGYKKLSEVAFQ
jgi:hypothetical protein